MKSNSIKILIGIIIAIFVAVFIYIFIQNINKESELNSKRMIAIQQINNSLSKNITDYNGARSTLSFRVKETYTDNLNEKYQLIINQLDKEENYLKNAKSNVVNLDEKCNGKMYSNAGINEICMGYKIYYEEIVNVFINDINQVNSIIDKYNEKNTNTLNKYTSQEFNNYIDYNKDGNYSGKE